MTPPEAHERLSSRTLFTLSLSRWKLRPGLRSCLFKIAHLVPAGHSLRSPVTRLHLRVRKVKHTHSNKSSQKRRLVSSTNYCDDSLLRAPGVPRHARHSPHDAEYHGELHAFALNRSEIPASETQRVPQPEPYAHARQNDDRVQDLPLCSLSGRDGERRAQNQRYQPDYGHERLSFGGRARDIWGNRRPPTGRSEPSRHSDDKRSRNRTSQNGPKTTSPFIEATRYDLQELAFSYNACFGFSPTQATVASRPAILIHAFQSSTKK